MDKRIILAVGVVLIIALILALLLITQSVWNSVAAPEEPVVAAPLPAMTLTGPPESYFGRSLALSGDRLVVGAFRENAFTGAVYCFDLTREGTAPTHRFSGEDTYNYFGHAVSVDGDQLAVGAFMAGVTDGNHSYASAGKAYFIDLGDERLHPMFGDGTNDKFGCAVAINDGQLVVGARQFGTNYTGMVRAFRVPAAGTPGVVRTIEGVEGSMFGCAVALVGNGCIVGAGGDQTQGPGTAYAYDMASGTVTHTLTGERDGDRFGCAVDIIGSVAVVGAPRAGTPVNAGCVYRYDLSTSSDTPAGMYQTGLAGDNFGCSVAIDGAYLLVGAYLADDTENHVESVGKAYLYNWTSGRLVAVFVGQAEGERLGYAVDLDAGRAAIGCFGTPKVYVYDLRDLME